VQSLTLTNLHAILSPNKEGECDARRHSAVSAAEQSLFCWPELAVNEPVLVLNRNYEPLNVCNTRRAFGLLMVGKAELIENGRGYIHTVSTRYPRPSVIRLVYLIKRPRRRVKLSKREVFRRDNYRCQYCGQASAHLTVDHIVPRRLGGRYAWDNLVTACPACNRRKGGRLLSEAHMRLLQSPVEPNASAPYLFGRQVNQYHEWSRYLEGW
jgi:5-methylcytosine-specific restriction endonuclease McrA